MTLSPGTRLGPYEILSPLGAGGMGEVYKANDTRLDRIVAIKILPEALAADPQFRERFDREGRAISQLTHPHICVLHDVGRQEGIDFLVMEYLEGETLADRLTKGALPLDQALQYAIQIADALDKAHRAGITHRDLKPGNVMLTKSGAKLLDFGLAKMAAPVVAGAGLSMPPTTPHNLTAQGTILGTFQYMAPEQLEGQDADARTDIFAFGAVVYEMVTGKKAFEGKSHATLIAAIISSDPPPIAAIQPLAPPALDRVVKKCLAKEPDERWQSAKDLHDELKWVAEGGSPVTTPAPGVVRRRGREPLAWTVAALAVVAGLVLAVPYVRRVPVDQAATKLSVLPPANAALSSDSVPAISPDGRRLAFVARDSSGTILLWVRPLDSLTAQPLAGTEEARQPFWSPDSRVLGFFSQGKLKRIDASGGPPQTLCDVSTPYGGTWSSAGVIAFVPRSLAPVEIVSAAGGQPKPVTRLDPSRQERSHSFPHFLPDGRHFLYLVFSAKREHTGVYVGSLDSTDTKRLMNAQSEARYAPPGSLLFVRDGSLMAQPFDASRLELSGDPLPIAEQVASDPNFGDGMFSASENGVLAYRGGGVSGNTSSDIAPMSWSPNGRFIVYRSVGRTGMTEAWVLPLFGDRKLLPLLQSEAFNQSSPRLSSDGRWVAYFSNETGRNEIFIQSFPKSAGKWQVTTGGGIHHRWSRDGKELFYLAPDQRLMVVTVKGGAAPDVGAARSLFVTRTLGGARSILGFRQQYDVAPDGQRLLMNVPVDEASAALTLVLNWTAGLKK